MIRKIAAASLTSTLILSGCGGTPLPTLNSTTTSAVTSTTSAQVIKHVVVIFGENVSFDHYFGTYPNALNLPGETKFSAATGTSTPNNYTSTPGLLTANPNLNSTNGAGASNPFRLAPAQAQTADQDHNYTDEETAFHAGKMDLFPLSVGTADSAAVATFSGAAAIASTKALTMGYYDGNTVTAFWNYAQHYALSDHSFGTNFGPSTQGALNLISGQINGVNENNSLALGSSQVADGNGGFTLVSDSDPYNDICSSTTKYAQMTSTNVGDLLNTASLTWGWFQGGFDLTVTNSNGTTLCKRSTASPLTGSVEGAVADYVPHHEPFQFYASTANPMHSRPTSIANIGKTDIANHQYDTHDFTDALAAGNMPAVSFIKAPAWQNGHAGNSNPIDEGTFVATMVNAIEQSQFWSSTAIILAYDDSDGWYDHMSNLVNGSATTADTLNGTGTCISTTAAAAALPGVTGTAPAGGRCGYGPRLPLVVISPWARKNYLDSTVTDQSSVLKFVEDTFLSSKRIGQGSFDSLAGSLNNMFDFSNAAVVPNPNVVVLNPATGVVTSGN